MLTLLEGWNTKKRFGYISNDSPGGGGGGFWAFYFALNCVLKFNYFMDGEADGNGRKKIK